MITITAPAAAAAAVTQVAGALTKVQNVYDQVNAVAGVVGAFKPQELKDALEDTVRQTVIGAFTPLITDLQALASAIDDLQAQIDAL